jgi:hypothetical protein
MLAGKDWKDFQSCWPQMLLLKLFVPLWLEAWSKGSAYGSHAKSVKLNLKLSSTQIDLQATLITTTLNNIQKHFKNLQCSEIGNTKNRQSFLECSCPDHAFHGLHYQK